MSRKYITTTLPYINADPHIGFALEILRADAWARFQRSQGNEVFLNTGTDEHGLKIYQKAQELGMDPQAYCDQQYSKWQDLQNVLNLKIDNFIRTNDPHHIKAAQEFWRRVDANGFIYKKFYKIKYCVGCEMEKTDSELVNGCCPLHPNKELEIIEEENYFLKYSALQDKLSQFYKENLNFVIPAKHFNEVKKFVEMGLEDFSISRLKSKMPWGVPVPGDDEQVMYVWFDALVNYISAIGWPDDQEKFEKWWPGIQVAGKDNLRPQSAMWQAMLIAAGLPNSKKIYINSFITSGGQKMSKSLGNVISPKEMVEKYGTDGTRYLLLSFDTFGEDMDITWQKLNEKFNADLANGLGNIVSRVSNLIEKNEIELDLILNSDGQLSTDFNNALDEFKLHEAIGLLWNLLRKNDEVLTKEQPWKLSDKETIKNILRPVAQDIYNIGFLLEPIMPQTAEKIKNIFGVKKIKKGEALFPRLT